jgi:hypothetical protein
MSESVVYVTTLPVSQTMQCRTVRGQSTGKDFQRRGQGLIEVVPQVLPGGTEENHKTPQSR